MVQKANQKQGKLSRNMTIYSKALAAAVFLIGAIGARPVSAQIELPRTAPTAGRDTILRTDIATIAPPETQLTLHADLSARNIVVKLGDNTIKTFDVAVGQDRYPTPTGEFTIERIVWNPSWHPPPNAAWAKGKTAKGPGEAGNPMKVVKIFFQDPTYYIHGTGDVESLGSAASHGCLRMDPTTWPTSPRFSWSTEESRARKTGSCGSSTLGGRRRRFTSVIRSC